MVVEATFELGSLTERDAVSAALARALASPALASTALGLTITQPPTVDARIVTSDINGAHLAPAPPPFIEESFMVEGERVMEHHVIATIVTLSVVAVLAAVVFGFTYARGRRAGVHYSRRLVEISGTHVGSASASSDAGVTLSAFDRPVVVEEDAQQQQTKL